MNDETDEESPGSKPRIPPGPLTFRRLLDEGLLKATASGKKGGASDGAALRAYMRANGLTEDDPCTSIVGIPETDFLEKLHSFEAGTSIAAASIASYRSRIRNWNDLATTLISEMFSEDKTFFDVLRAGYKSYLASDPRHNKTVVVTLLRMDNKAFDRWFTKGTYNPTVNPVNLRRSGDLERLFGFPRGVLSSRLSRHPDRKGRTRSDISAKKALTSDNKMRLDIIRYRAMTLPKGIEEFFNRYLSIKTTSEIITNMVGQAIDRSGSVWRVVDPAKPAPSAVLVKMRLALFVGWLMLPTDLAGAARHVAENCIWKKTQLTQEQIEELAPNFIGKGLLADDITPGHTVDPVLVSSFFEWYKRRGNKKPTDFVTDALQMIGSPDGFLYQQVECVWHHSSVRITPIDMGAEDVEEAYSAAAKKWHTKCEQWRKQLKRLLDGTADNAGSSVAEKLRPILDRRDLMGVIDHIITTHASDRPAGKLDPSWSGHVALAIWVRNQLLLRMLASNPLRNRNFREMRYTPDNKGNLYRGVDGDWRLRFQPSEFKNERGAAREVYDVPVRESLWPLIDVYITKARPILLRKVTDPGVFFVNRDGEPFDVNGISVVVRDLTGMYAQEEIETFGFRTHAFRHIIATAWLREHPKDYLTVAHILHDKLETVLQNYAHVKPNSGLAQYDAWLSTREMPIELRWAA